MDDTPPPPARALNYFQQSPVRGQLEPTDGVSRSGWRYLQCTDTPNELRVREFPLRFATRSSESKFEGTFAAADGADIQLSAQGRAPGAGQGQGRRLG